MNFPYCLEIMIYRKHIYIYIFEKICNELFESWDIYIDLLNYIMYIYIYILCHTGD